MPLEIVVPKGRLYDEINNEFIDIPETRLRLENSLLSLSKWESKWHKPFLISETDKALGAAKDITNEEYIDYIRCMTLNSHVDPNVYLALSKENQKAITDYLNDPMTATVISPNKKNKKNSMSSSFITSELIYYWLVALQIPFDPVEKWPLPRLITLITVCNEKNQPPEKLSMAERYKQNRMMNEARRKARHSKG